MFKRFLTMCKIGLSDVVGQVQSVRDIIKYHVQCDKKKLLGSDYVTINIK